MNKVIDFIGTFFKKAFDDSLPAYAAQVTFFVVLSFFPFLIVLLLIASKLPISSEYVLNRIMDVVPAELEDYVRLVATEVSNSDNTSLSSITIVSVFVSLWSSGKGIQAMTYGLNRVYRVEKNRNFVLLRLLSSLYTLAFALMLFLIMSVYLFGSNIVRRVVEQWPDLAKTTILIYSLKNGFTFIILFVLFLIVYYQLPGRKGRFRYELAGAAFASLMWMLMTNGFSLFIRFSSKASYMYGSLTSIILIIIWLYIGMQIILYGAEINYYVAGYVEFARKRKDKYGTLVDTE